MQEILLQHLSKGKACDFEMENNSKHATKAALCDEQPSQRAGLSSIENLWAEHRKCGWAKRNGPNLQQITVR